MSLGWVTAYLVFQVDSISGVTASEAARIRATFHAAEYEKFDCNKCVAQYAGRPNGEEMTAKLQKSKACRSKEAAPIQWIGKDLGFRTCIGNFVSPQVRAMTAAFNKFQSGVMPYSGGLMEQPAKIISVFQLMEVLTVERMERERQKAERANKPQGGRHGR